MDVLEKALEITSGARAQTYGEYTLSFNHIAEYWNIYLQYHFKKRNSTLITAPDVAVLMQLLKRAREDNSKHEDNLVDIAGYLRLENLLKEESKVSKGGDS